MGGSGECWVELLPWMMNMRGMVALRVRDTRVKRREQMSMMAWLSTGRMGGAGRCASDGGNDAEGNDGGNNAVLRQPKSSLTTASVTACGVLSTGGNGCAVAKVSGAAALPSMAKSSTRGISMPLKKWLRFSILADERKGKALVTQGV
jgi:hypothetical protein